MNREFAKLQLVFFAYMHARYADACPYEPQSSPHRCFAYMGERLFAMFVFMKEHKVRFRVKPEPEPVILSVLFLLFNVSKIQLQLLMFHPNDRPPHVDACPVPRLVDGPQWFAQGEEFSLDMVGAVFDSLVECTRAAHDEPDWTDKPPIHS